MAETAEEVAASLLDFIRASGPAPEDVVNPMRLVLTAPRRGPQSRHMVRTFEACLNRLAEHEAAALDSVIRELAAAL